MEGGAKVLSLAQDGDPRKPGLEPIQNELFVQTARIVFGYTSLLFVVVDVERVGARPAAADSWLHRRDFFFAFFAAGLRAGFFARIPLAALAASFTSTCNVASILLPSRS
jgi:hypothetical protein